MIEGLNMNRYKIYMALYILLAKYLPASYTMFGKLSKRIRTFFGKRILKYSGESINIEHGAEFNRLCSCGTNSGIGVNCKLQGPVEIGENVMIGPECLFYTVNHEHSRLDIPMNEQGATQPKKIIIEDDVWLGSRVIVLPGVTIGKGSIIGAGTVLTKSVPPYSIVAGNPGKVVRNRKYNVIKNNRKL